MISSTVRHMDVSPSNPVEHKAETTKIIGCVTEHIFLTSSLSQNLNDGTSKLFDEQAYFFFRLPDLLLKSS
jgi:hypothetical protein